MTQLAAHRLLGIFLIALVGTSAALADWSAGDATWTPGSAVWDPNPSCAALTYDTSASGSMVSATAYCDGGYCSNSQHSGHVGAASRATTGYRTLTCTCEGIDEPGTGTSTIEGSHTYSLVNGYHNEELTVQTWGKSYAQTAIAGSSGPLWQDNETGDSSETVVWEDPTPSATSSDIHNEDTAMGYVWAWGKVMGLGYGKPDNFGTATNTGECTGWTVEFE